MNIIEQYSKDNGVKAAAIAAKTGLTVQAVWRHMRGMRAISAEAAVAYHSGLGLPLAELRPDLYGAAPAQPSPASESAATTTPVCPVNPGRTCGCARLNRAKHEGHDSPCIVACGSRRFHLCDCASLYPTPVHLPCDCGCGHDCGPCPRRSQP